MHVPSHLKFWMIVSIMMFFVMIATVPPETYIKVAKQDIQNIYATYGMDAGVEIVTNANSTFTDLLGNGAVSDAFGTLTVNTDDSSKAVFGGELEAAHFTNRMLRTMKLEIYSIILRATAAWQWFVVMVVFSLVAIVDGLVERKIKLLGYGYTSPAIQSRLAHLSVAVAGVSLSMLYMPASVPLLWWPCAAVAVAVAARFIASNIKQVTV